MSEALAQLKQAIADANTSFSAELDTINAKLAGLANGASADEIAAVTADVSALKQRIDSETVTLSGN